MARTEAFYATRIIRPSILAPFVGCFIKGSLYAAWSYIAARKIYCSRLCGIRGSAIIIIIIRIVVGPCLFICGHAKFIIRERLVKKSSPVYSARWCFDCAECNKVCASVFCCWCAFSWPYLATPHSSLFVYFMACSFMCRAGKCILTVPLITLY